MGSGRGPGSTGGVRYPTTRRYPGSRRAGGRQESAPAEGSIVHRFLRVALNTEYLNFNVSRSSPSFRQRLMKKTELFCDSHLHFAARRATGTASHSVLQ
jgi:hypothetical protein